MPEQYNTNPIDEHFQSLHQDLDIGGFREELWLGLESQLNAAAATTSATSATASATAKGSGGLLGLGKTTLVALSVSVTTIAGGTGYLLVSEDSAPNSLLHTAMTTPEPVLEKAVEREARLPEINPEKEVQLWYSPLVPRQTGPLATTSGSSRDLAPLLRKGSEPFEYAGIYQGSRNHLQPTSGEDVRFEIEMRPANISELEAAANSPEVMVPHDPSPAEGLAIEPDANTPNDTPRVAIASPPPTTIMQESEAASAPIDPNAHLAQHLSESSPQNRKSHGVTPETEIIRHATATPQLLQKLAARPIAEFANRPFAQQAATRPEPFYDPNLGLPGGNPSALHGLYLTGGLNYSQGLSNLAGKNGDYKLGFLGGIGYRFPIGRHWETALEVVYFQTNGHHIGDSLVRTKSYLTTTTETLTSELQSLDMVQIPLTIGYRLKPRHTILGGAYASLPVRSNSRLSHSLEREGVISKTTDLGNHSGYHSMVQPFIFGGSIGYNYQVFESLSLEGRVRQDLSQLVNETSLQPSGKARLTQFQLTVKIHPF